MSVLKRLSRSEGLRAALCLLTSLYIRFVHFTSRWERIGYEWAASALAGGRPVILAFWHGRLLMMPKGWPGGRIHMLISQHRDGRLIARTVAHFGIRSVAGSTSRGGGSAVRTMLRALKDGESVGITPDGPRGPRMRASQGAISIARLSGAVILPMSYSAPGKVLGSWDSFVLPRPFGRGVFICGEPLAVPRDASDADMERLRRELEDRLNAITRTADERVGRPPVQPAEWPAATETKVTAS